MKKKSILIAVLGIALIIMASGCGSSKGVDLAINAIDDIGKVTFDSGQAIEEAESMYNDLSENNQISVTNKDILFEAREKYDKINMFVSVGEEEQDGYYCIISSDKLSIEVDTNPLDIDDFSNHDTLDTIKNIHKKLDLPDSLYKKMVSTRAIDGRQSQSFTDVTVNWTYHPNNGLAVLYELNQ